jgi:photosystem II stability/assembly factor-like uncharacterized protein
MKTSIKLFFKLTAVLMFFLLVMVSTSQAQTPQYYNYALIEGTNYYPFGVPGGERVDFLYPAGNLNQPTIARSGNITKIYFYMGYTNGNATLTNLTIKMGQSSITTLPTGTYYTGQMDTVYYRASVNITSTIGAWMSFTLDHPFTYDSTKSLIVGIQQCGATNNSVVVCQHAYSGARRSYSYATPCPCVYYGQDANAANFGIDVTPVLPTGWTPQVSGVTTGLNTVSAVNQNVGWIGGNSGVVLRTTNGGANWTNVTGSPIGTDAVYAICGIDANTCLVSTSPSATYVFRTSNGGANWTQVFTQAGGFIDDIKFQSASTGFMYGDPVGSRWSLWKSTNAGATWDSTGLYLAQNASEAGWNNAMWLIGNNLWFGTNNTRVYYSTNFGASWNFGATTGSANQYSVGFFGSTGFCGQTIALKSTDGGANWATFTVPGSGTLYSFNGVAGRFWYCNTSQIYWSSDNGGSFASQYTGTGTYDAMNLTLDGNIIRGWAVTTAGGIAMYNEVLTGINNNRNEIPSDYALTQNYPNPFNPTTKIAFSLPKAGNVRLAVYDMLGREVAVLTDENFTAGTHTIDFNASNLASGVYLYKIESGSFIDTKKMVLVK